jgi:hypothetical protein
MLGDDQEEQRAWRGWSLMGDDVVRLTPCFLEFQANQRDWLLELTISPSA